MSPNDKSSWTLENPPPPRQIKELYLNKTCIFMPNFQITREYDVTFAVEKCERLKVRYSSSNLLLLIIAKHYCSK